MRKQKMTLETLVSLGYDYIDSMPVYSHKTGKKGIRYVLDKYLTDEETKALQQSYKNIVVSDCYYRYAPEIKHSVIIILK